MNNQNGTPYDFVASTIAGGYFMSSKNDKVVHSIRLINPVGSPYRNADYPYQIILFWYNPGYAFFADTQTLHGGIGVDGHIGYSTWTGGLKGRLIDNNTIAWSDGSFWRRINLPPLEVYNPYTKQAVLALDEDNSAWLSDRLDNAYPYTPGIQGL